jgi:hypothetical protein
MTQHVFLEQASAGPRWPHLLRPESALSQHAVGRWHHARSLGFRGTLFGLFALFFSCLLVLFLCFLRLLYRSICCGCLHITDHLPDRSGGTLFFEHFRDNPGYWGGQFKSDFFSFDHNQIFVLFGSIALGLKPFTDFDLSDRFTDRWNFQLNSHTASPTLAIGD